MYSLLEHVVAPRDKSMNRKNDFEKALKIFCRHSSDYYENVILSTL